MEVVFVVLEGMAGCAETGRGGAESWASDGPTKVTLFMRTFLAKAESWLVRRGEEVADTEGGC